VTTGALIRQVEDVGYVVKVFHVSDTVEMHAVLLRDPDVFHVARCNDGDGEEAYRAACLLARACGVELGDA
jgi:hypothetical protein